MLFIKQSRCVGGWWCFILVFSVCVCRGVSLFFFFSKALCFLLLNGIYSSEPSRALPCQDSWWGAHLLSRDMARWLTLAGDRWGLTCLRSHFLCFSSPSVSGRASHTSWCRQSAARLTLCRNSLWISLERTVVIWPALLPGSADREAKQSWVFLMILISKINNISQMGEQLLVPDMEIWVYIWKTK